MITGWSALTTTRSPGWSGESYGEANEGGSKNGSTLGMSRIAWRATAVGFGVGSHGVGPTDTQFHSCIEGIEDDRDVIDLYVVVRNGGEW